MMMACNNVVERVFHREVGRDRVRGCGGKIPPSFNDILTGTMSSLMWKEGQSQHVHSSATTLDPIPIYAMTKLPNCSRLIIGDESGHMHILENWFNPLLKNLNKNPTIVNSIHVTDNSAVTSVKAVGDKIFVGTGSGHVCILNEAGTDLISSFGSHYKAVKKVDTIFGDVIVSCGKDNQIYVYDVRMKAGNPVNLVHQVHSFPIRGDGASSSSDGVGGSSQAGSHAGRGRRHRSQPPCKEHGSLSSSVTDFVFLDENRIISAGSSDGRLKEWDLRLSYKQFTKCTPVQVVEYPSQSINVRGYSCLHLAGCKLFASSVHYEIFELDVNTMTCDATYVSPSKISNYTKIDVSSDANYLACGSDESLVHIFSTQKRKNNRDIAPFKSLNHAKVSDAAVCCPLFSPWDDLSLTTGGDASIVTKWSPTIYLETSKELEKEARKQELEQEPVIVTRKTEFHSLPSRRRAFLSPKKQEQRSDKENNSGQEKMDDNNDKSYIPRQRVCFAKLDSFPNYVVDGMTALPHFCPPRIRINLRPRGETAIKNWVLSPLVKEMSLKAQTQKEQIETEIKKKTEVITAIKVQAAKETTPIRNNKSKTGGGGGSSAGRKRRKFCDENLSPKIMLFFSPISQCAPPVASPLAGTSKEAAEATLEGLEQQNSEDVLSSPVSSLKINKTGEEEINGEKSPPD